jgi:hypothetical protein
MAHQKKREARLTREDDGNSKEPAGNKQLLEGVIPTLS